MGIPISKEDLTNVIKKSSSEDGVMNFVNTVTRGISDVKEILRDMRGIQGTVQKVTSPQQNKPIGAGNPDMTSKIPSQAPKQAIAPIKLPFDPRKKAEQLFDRITIEINKHREKAKLLNGEQLIQLAFANKDLLIDMLAKELEK